MKVFIVIPARYSSIRLPGKPLALIGTKPMIQWVYERAQLVKGASGVIVATDDRRIAEAVRNFGGDARMTSSRHRTGTERVAQIAGRLKGEVFVNLQGDEPFIDPGTIDRVIAPMRGDKDIVMSTAMYPISGGETLHDPGIVKVVVGRGGWALYFSRQPIPFHRNGSPRGRKAVGCKHIGLYAFRRDFLLRFARMKPTPLEREEGLEQLRALEHGYRIKVVTALRDSVSVDTPEDLRRARRLQGAAG